MQTILRYKLINFDELYQLVLALTEEGLSVISMVTKEAHDETIGDYIDVIVVGEYVGEFERFQEALGIPTGKTNA